MNAENRERSDDNARLLDALAAGSELAFEQVYDRFAAELLRAAQAVAADRSLAEDAVQEAFVGLVKTGTRAKEIRNLRAYLFTAVVRAARRNRLARPNTQPLEIDPAMPHTDVTSPHAERLARALQLLPQDQREVLTLHLDGGLTFEETAAELNISANTAASRYRYALEKLRTALNPSVLKEGAQA